MVECQKRILIEPALDTTGKRRTRRIPWTVASPCIFDIKLIKKIIVVYFANFEHVNIYLIFPFN